MRKRNANYKGCQLFVGIDTLAGMLECGRNTADKIGTEAGARVQYGRCVRYSVAKVEEYMNALTEKGV